MVFEEVSGLFWFLSLHNNWWSHSIGSPFRGLSKSECIRSVTIFFRGIFSWFAMLLCFCLVRVLGSRKRHMWIQIRTYNRDGFKAWEDVEVPAFSASGRYGFFTKFLVFLSVCFLGHAWWALSYFFDNGFYQVGIIICFSDNVSHRWWCHVSSKERSVVSGYEIFEEIMW